MTVLTSHIPQMCTHCLYFWNVPLFRLGSLKVWTVFAVFIQANKTEHILRIVKSLFMSGICIWAWRFHLIFLEYLCMCWVWSLLTSLRLCSHGQGGGMFLKAKRDFITRDSKRDFFYETLLWKNVWSFCHLLLPDSLLLRSCKKQDICTLGCHVLWILRVMGFWELAKQKHFMNILY